MISRLLIACSFVVVLALPVSGVSRTRIFRVRLEPIIHQRNTSWSVFEPERASADEVVRVGLELDPEASYFVCEVPWGEAMAHVVVVVREGERAVLVDADLDGRVAERDRALVVAESPEAGLVWQATARLPVGDAYFGAFPVTFALRESGAGPDPVFEVLVKIRAVAHGTILVDGRRAVVEAAVEPGTGRLHPRRTILGVDANGDGVISDGPLDGEQIVAVDEEAIVRVGRRALALTRFDERSHSLEFESRPAASAPIGLARGSRLPDLSYVDLDGRRRRLGEYRGRVLLIVFWTSWCAPCIAEMPALEDLASRYAARGLVVLGVSGDESNEAAAIAVRRLGVSWPQAAPVAAGRSLRDAFRVRQWPTHALVGRDGRVRTTSDEDLRGETLERSIVRALDATAKNHVR